MSKRTHTTVSVSPAFKQALRLVAALEQEAQMHYLDRVILPILQAEIRETITAPGYHIPSTK
jgi:hypothetical protein